MPEVSIVIVCMNRPDILFPCLDSIRAHTGVSYETLVVAYLFSPENLKLWQERYPWVTVVPSSELRGFSENNNLALKQASGRYCFVVNDDTIMNEPVIDRLVADLEKLPSDAAAVSPCIRFADGRIQTCGRAPWTPWRYAMHYLHLVDETRPSKWNMVTPSLLSGRGWPEISGSVPSSVFRTYTLNGACFLIKTDIFRQVGFLGRFGGQYHPPCRRVGIGHGAGD